MEAPAVQVTVVGGGLAGMTAALALGELGLSVRLLEAEQELGGMCGSKTIDGYVEDHGFHILQPWYRNMHRLVDKLGIAGNFVDCPNYYQLLPGEFPLFRNFRTLFTLRDVVDDVRGGVTPAPDRILFYYLLVDLLSQRLGAARRPDLPFKNFLASRWYLTRTAARELEHFILTASAWDFECASARTFRAGIAAAACHRQHIRMPQASLSEALIEPFQRQLERLGTEVITGCELVAVGIGPDGVVELTLRCDERIETVLATQVVLAIPHGRLAALGPSVCDRLIPASGVPKLRSRPLGALHLHLRRSMAELPGAHVRLVKSRYAVSLIDIGKFRDGIDGSVLNCVIGRVSALRELSEDEAVRRVVDEIIQYLPSLQWGDIKHVCYQPHFQQPFFMADADSWQYRPASSTQLANLYIAGDFSAVAPGHVAMEAAVVSGLFAAESVRQSTGTGGPRIEILEPEEVSPSLALVGKVALAPVAAATRLIAVLRREGTHCEGLSD